MKGIELSWKKHRVQTNGERTEAKWASLPECLGKTILLENMVQMRSSMTVGKLQGFSDEENWIWMFT